VTNFSRLSALKGAVIVLLAVMCGCGSKDGTRELAQGREAYEARDLKKAEQLFEESLALAPQDVDRIVSLARVKLDLGELSAAEDLVGRAESLAKGDADVAMLSGQVAWHAKDYKRAAKIFLALATDMNQDPAVRSDARSAIGIIEMTCSHYHLARLAFLRAILLNRQNAAAWYHLGLLYRDGFGYLEAALEQFEIYVRLEVTASPRVQKVQRTVIPALKEQIAHAATEHPGVARRDSSASAAAIAKAETATKKGRHKEARQSYEEALKADPLSYEAAIGLAKTWEKLDSSPAGLAKAFENYKIACQLHPGTISTFLTAGALAMRLGYHLQALEIYSRAVAAGPTSLEAIDGLIRAMRKTGKSNEAQSYQIYRDSLTAKNKKK